MNAGSPHGQLSACFVLPIQDSLESIFSTLKSAAKIHQSGGGTGFSFSAIRPRGDVVKTTGGAASGPVSFIRLFDTMTDVIKQGCRRRGANMAIICCRHPDILGFVTSKPTASRLQNFNLSVGTDDAFMRAVRLGTEIANEPEEQQVYGGLGLEIFDHGSRGLAHRRPGHGLARRGEPQNPRGRSGRSRLNPCGEQPLHPSESCTLGSVNLGKMIDARGRFDWKRLEGIVKLGVRFLDDVLDANSFPTRRSSSRRSLTAGSGSGSWASPRLDQLATPTACSPSPSRGSRSASATPRARNPRSSDEAVPSQLPVLDLEEGDSGDEERHDDDHSSGQHDLDLAGASSASNRSRSPSSERHGGRGSSSEPALREGREGARLPLDPPSSR
jgi:hypothetical protein